MRIITVIVRLPGCPASWGGGRHLAAQPVMLVALFGAMSLVVPSQANAQLHGVGIAKSCGGPFCPGQTTDCTLQIGHADGFGDTIRILGAFDCVNPPCPAGTRVPAAPDPAG
jgi:hypothetical protein